MSPLTLPAAT